MILGIHSDIEAAYWIIALSSTFLFLFRFLLSVLGGDSADGDGGDGDGFSDDAEADADESGHDDVLSLDTVLAFLKGAGWVGVICYRFTRFAPLSIFAITMTSGVITFFFAWFLLKNIRRIESSGTMEMKNAVGNVGTVYMRIPANGADTGQIQVEIQGRLATVNARSMKEELRTGDRVIVCAVDKRDNAMLVAPYPYKDEL